ncbi:RNA-directed DNA polymerase, eukaryota [Tanacetum coccineum]
MLEYESVYTSDDESKHGARILNDGAQNSDVESDDECNVDGVSETVFSDNVDECNVDGHGKETDKQQSEDLFGFYDLLNKLPAKGVRDASTSLSHPPGFTPKTSVTHANVGEICEDGPTNGEDMGVHNGGSILDILDDMVRVGHSMGYNLDGCLKDMERIIGSQGDEDDQFFSVARDKVDVFLLWTSPWGNSNFDFVASDSLGNSGGILCIWEASIFKKDGATISDNFIAIYGTWLPRNVKILLVAVYAPQQPGSKRALWVFILILYGDGIGEVFIMGDLMTVWSMDETTCGMGTRLLGRIPPALKWSQLSIRGVFVEALGVLIEYVDELDRAVSRDEIRRAVWNCGENKSPGPNGYTVLIRFGGLSLGYFQSVLVWANWCRVDPCLRFSHIACSVNISHLFYADDAMFIGEWSEQNLHNIVKVLNCFHLASVLKINIAKSQILGVEVPKGVLKTMESIRSKFFNGVDSSDRKISWVAWVNVLASKLNGGLGVSSFFALNRALLLKWVWRFISGDGSLWCKVIQAIYGSKFDLHVTDQPSIWCSILREVKSLKDSGFDFSSHCKKRIGDGSCTSFWYDIWLADAPLCVQFPRLFALELDKEIVVANKMRASSVSASFRRDVRDGAERQQWDDLSSIMNSVVLSSSKDRWTCDLSGDGEFKVKVIRNFIDDLFLPSSDVETRWVKFIPIKVNVFSWRARRDRLPTRVNLSRRGVLLDSHLCPLCNAAMEDVQHVFFRCDVARVVLRKICRWWDLDWQEICSFSDWDAWFLSFRLSSRLKSILEGVFYVAWWRIWRLRNQLVFDASPPNRSTIFDDIVSWSFLWCSSRCNRVFSWEYWLKNPYLISL